MAAPLDLSKIQTILKKFNLIKDTFCYYYHVIDVAFYKNDSKLEIINLKKNRRSLLN